jgi:hypothetical protein
MASIGELVISLRADIASFRSGMDDANRKLKDVQSQFESAKQAAAHFVETVASLYAIREVAGFMEQAAAATQAWADKLATFQGLAGVSSQAAATLAGATQLAGVNADVVTQAMARLGVVMATHPQKLVDIGVATDVVKLKQMSMTEILRATVGALDQYKAGTDRAQAAGYAMGRGAEAWLTQLDKLGPELQSAELDKTTEMMQALGLSMADAKREAADWANATGTLKLEWLAFQVQVGQQLLPYLKELGTEILTLAKDGSFKQWAQDSAFLIHALAGEAEGAAWAIDKLANAARNMSDESRLNYRGMGAMNAGAPQGRASLLRPWMPTGDISDALSGGAFGLSLPPGAAGGGTAGPDGTKTFNVPDPKIKQLNDSIATLTASYQRHIEENTQLIAAMAKSKDGAKALADQFAAEDKILAIRAQAMRLGITLTNAQASALETLALKEGASKDLLERQTQIRAALDAQTKRQNEDLLKIAQSADMLTEKEQKLADAEGALWAAFNQGAISAQEFDARLKVLVAEFNGPDKGMKEFTSGLSSSLSTAIGKMTDFSAIMAEAGKKGGQSVFQQFRTDTMDFVKSLDQLLMKLLVINPILNSLGLGDQGNGKLLPTLGGAGGLLGWLKGLFGGGAGAADMSFTGVDAGLGSTFADAGMAGFAGFASGGAFDVGGKGGTDSSLVQFKATPGEHVSVGQDRGAGAAPMNVIINNNHSSAAVSAAAHPNGRDMIVQIDEMVATKVRTGGATARAMQDSFGASRVPIQR